ncbi:hypothetical protein SAMD00019534_089620 [Acytostelium subglobosum LB1]|uniref:hypothetical protein n=1 Tax=Acytostelium subglobosum LB1 TaxID=1410327 RepID=UPI00064507E3|nr:hypothetical protein SAMD00019534_089620 [Acytostelium subglobosum LB1]GAM25787.1 hypothetical protein SAMD00019534_089620 [Acytostelium subglobosum LB1]|eukprot:XP_012751305.1 hypothetical protein SAMD00019534_089620 [Acytostelium subglobosum LB1]
MSIVLMAAAVNSTKLNVLYSGWMDLMSYNQIDIQTGKTVEQYCDVPKYFHILSMLNCKTSGGYGGDFIIFAKVMCNTANLEYCSQVVTYNSGSNNITPVTGYIPEPKYWNNKAIGQGLYGYNSMTQTVYYLAQDQGSKMIGVVAASGSPPSKTFNVFPTPKDYVNVGSFYDASTESFYVAMLDETSRLTITKYDVLNSGVNQSAMSLGVSVDPSDQGFFSIFVYDNMLYAAVASKNTDSEQDFPLWIGSVDLETNVVTPIIQQSGVSVNFSPYAMYPFAFEPATGFLSAYVQPKNATYDDPNILYLVNMSNGQFTKSPVTFQNQITIDNGADIILSPY